MPYRKARLVCKKYCYTFNLPYNSLPQQHIRASWNGVIKLVIISLQNQAD